MDDPNDVEPVKYKWVWKRRLKVGAPSLLIIGAFLTAETVHPVAHEGSSPSKVLTRDCLPIANQDHSHPETEAGPPRTGFLASAVTSTDTSFSFFSSSGSPR